MYRAASKFVQRLLSDEQKRSVLQSIRSDVSVQIIMKLSEKNIKQCYEMTFNRVSLYIITTMNIAHKT